MSNNSLKLDANYGDGIIAAEQFSIASQVNHEVAYGLHGDLPDPVDVTADLESIIETQDYIIYALGIVKAVKTSLEKALPLAELRYRWGGNKER